MPVRPWLTTSALNGPVSAVSRKADDGTPRSRSKPVSSPRTRPVTRFTPAALTRSASRAMSIELRYGSPLPRRYRFPFTTPSGSGGTPASASVVKRASAPSRRNAAADTYSFSTDAGMRWTPARLANSSAPLSRSTTNAPEAAPAPAISRASARRVASGPAADAAGATTAARSRQKRTPSRANAGFTREDNGRLRRKSLIESTSLQRGWATS